MRKFNLLSLAIILLLAIVNVQKVNAQHFTISNNLLYDATLTPNLRLGARLSPHWSLGLTACWSQVSFRPVEVCSWRASSGGSCCCRCLLWLFLAVRSFLESGNPHRLSARLYLVWPLSMWSLWKEDRQRQESLCDASGWREHRL